MWIFDIDGEQHGKKKVALVCGMDGDTICRDSKGELLYVSLQDIVASEYVDPNSKEWYEKVLPFTKRKKVSQ